MDPGTLQALGPSDTLETLTVVTTNISTSSVPVKEYWHEGKRAERVLSNHFNRDQFGHLISGGSGFSSVVFR